ncbi:hypothetical protein H1R20_g8974, partial [Candolleomyces eurysporus]
MAAYQSRAPNALNTVAMLFHWEYIRSQARKQYSEKDINRAITLISSLTDVSELTIEWDESNN